MRAPTLLLAALLTALLAACSPRRSIDADAAVLADAGPRDGSAGDRVSLSFLTPERGPFGGGTRVTLAGSGFTLGTDVYVDGTRVSDVLVQPLSATRLVVRMPPHAPGTVDVEVRRGEASAVLDDAYTYEALAVDPEIGPAAGGLRVSVRVEGAPLEGGDVPHFGGAPCSEIELRSATEIACRTPAGSPGAVDVEIRRGDAVIASAIAAFTYVDAPLTFGGATGGAIEGELEVVVQGWVGPIEDARVTVIAGEERLEGRTDAEGRLRLSGAFTGPLDVHAQHPCYGTTSFVGIDARTLVVPLQPARTGGACPAPPAGAGTSAPSGLVEGRALFLDGSEFPEPQRIWLGVPPAPEGKERVAYAFGVNAIAAIEGTPFVARITEDDWDGTGFPFRVQSASGSVRVQVVAGLQEVGRDSRDETFTPYVLGVSSPIVVPPLATATGADAVMDVPLDRAVELTLPPPAGERVVVATSPTATGLSPDTYVAFLTVVGTGVTYGPFVAEGQRAAPSTWTTRVPRVPRPGGSLGAADLSLGVCWGASCGLREELFAVPSAGGATLLAIDDLLPIPAWQQPSHGGRLAAGDIVEIALDAATDVVLLVIQPQPWTLGSPGAPWTLFVRGDRRTIALPVLDDDALVPGTNSLIVQAERREGFDFDAFSVRDLALRQPERRASNTAFVTVDP